MGSKTTELHRARSRRHLAPGVAFCLSLAVAGCQSTPVRQSASLTVDDKERGTACSVREISRQRLTLEDGREIYVEAEAVVANSRGDVLLLGMPNYITGKHPRGDMAQERADNSVFGVVIPRRGPVRAIPLPVPGKLVTGLRAIPRSDDTWAVAFAEQQPSAEFPPPDSAVRLWYGVFNGGGWEFLEELPMPREGRLAPFLASSLVQHGDTLAWAMTLFAPTHEENVAVFQRHGGRWSLEVVRTIGAAYAEVGHSKGLGFALAVVEPDRTLPRDGNSLFLYARDGSWQTLGKVVPGGREPIYAPSFTHTSSGARLTWWALVRDAGRTRREARTLLQAPNARVVTIDSNIAQALVPLTLRDGQPLWVTDHVPSVGEQREIRFVRESAGAAVVLGGIPSPFTGGFGATAVSQNEVLVAGPLLDRAEEELVTLLLRTRLECHPRLQ